jgi:PKD repeat protein
MKLTPNFSLEELTFSQVASRRGIDNTPSAKVKDNLERISNIFTGSVITVNGVVNNPPAPGFNWSQTSYSPNLKIKFTDTSSDDEGPIVAWNWKFGDNQTADVQNPEHIYSDPGTYLVVLTGKDTIKTLPLPFILLALTSPPWTSAIHLTIANPKPMLFPPDL